MKKYILLFLGLLSGLEMLAQQKTAETKKTLLEDIRKEKWRTPVPIEDAIKAFEAKGSGTRKLRAVNELKVSSSNSTAIEEGEAHIAMDPNNNNNLVMSYMDNSSTGLTYPIYFSSDAGQTWTKSSFNALTYLNEDFPGAFVAGGGDPIFAYDKTGKLYFSWIYLAFSPTVIDTAYACMYLASSSDNGSSWTVAPAPDRYIGRSALDILTFETYANSDGFYDRQWFAVDLTSGANANALYCSFVYFPNVAEPVSLTGQTIKKKASAAAGFNPTKHQVFSAGTQFGNVAVDKLGNVHVTFADLDQQRVMHAVSNDGGNTFSSAHVIANGINLFGSQGNGYIHDRENSAVNMCLDGSNHIHVVWSDFPSSPGPDYDSYYSRSTDGGMTWSTPLLLSTKFIAGSKVLMPTVCASNNRVSIGGYVIDNNKVSDYYMMTSTDNGNSWLPAQKISTQSTSFANSSNLTKWFGDYYNAVRNDTKVYNIWSDGRNTTGPKMYVSITTEWPTGFTEVTPINGSFSLDAYYPVPLTNELSLRLNSQKNNTLELTLTAMDGKTIQHQSLNLQEGQSVIKVPLAPLSTGNYILTLESADGYRLTRLMTK